MPAGALVFDDALSQAGVEDLPFGGIGASGPPAGAAPGATSAGREPRLPAEGWRRGASAPGSGFCDMVLIVADGAGVVADGDPRRLELGEGIVCVRRD